MFAPTVTRHIAPVLSYHATLLPAEDATMLLGLKSFVHHRQTITLTLYDAGVHRLGDASHGESVRLDAGLAVWEFTQALKFE